MSHLIKIYAVCKFSWFRLRYLKSQTELPKSLIVPPVLLYSFKNKYHRICEQKKNPVSTGSSYVRQKKKKSNIQVLSVFLHKHSSRKPNIFYRNTPRLRNKILLQFDPFLEKNSSISIFNFQIPLEFYKCVTTWIICNPHLFL